MTNSGADELPNVPNLAEPTVESRSNENLVERMCETFWTPAIWAKADEELFRKPERVRMGAALAVTEGERGQPRCQVRVIRMYGDDQCVLAEHSDEWAHITTGDMELWMASMWPSPVEVSADGFDRTKEHSEHFGAPAEAPSVTEARDIITTHYHATGCAAAPPDSGRCNCGLDDHADALIAAVQREQAEGYAQGFAHGQAAERSKVAFEERDSTVGKA